MCECECVCVWVYVCVCVCVCVCVLSVTLLGSFCSQAEIPVCTKLVCVLPLDLSALSFSETAVSSPPVQCFQLTFLPSSPSSPLLLFLPLHHQNMFTGFSVVSATELVLGANENIDNVQRLKWNVNGGEWVWLEG